MFDIIMIAIAVAAMYIIGVTIGIYIVFKLIRAADETVRGHSVPGPNWRR
jgi:hypothetical protein